jgi:hypothetical protein
MRKLWEAWKRIGKRIGDIQARVLLIFFYFVVLSPFALVLRWVSDPLAIKPGAQRSWGARKAEKNNSMEWAMKQF